MFYKWTIYKLKLNRICLTIKLYKVCFLKSYASSSYLRYGHKKGSCFLLFVKKHEPFMCCITSVLEPNTHCCEEVYMLRVCIFNVFQHLYCFVFCLLNLFYQVAFKLVYEAVFHTCTQVETRNF